VMQEYRQWASLMRVLVEGEGTKSAPPPCHSRHAQRRTDMLPNEEPQRLSECC